MCCCGLWLSHSLTLQEQHNVTINSQTLTIFNDDEVKKIQAKKKLNVALDSELSSMIVAVVSYTDFEATEDIIKKEGREQGNEQLKTSSDGWNHSLTLFSTAVAVSNVRIALRCRRGDVVARLLLYTHSGAEL